MPRGGARPNSGPSSRWRHGKTKTIRVPIVLADRLLEIAKQMDEQSSSEPVSFSKDKVSEPDSGSMERLLKRCSEEVCAQVPIPKRKLVSRYLNRLAGLMLQSLGQGNPKAAQRSERSDEG